MGALLLKKHNSPKTDKGLKVRKKTSISKHGKRINWVILSKEDVEASRPKDAYEYVV